MYHEWMRLLLSLVGMIAIGCDDNPFHPLPDGPPDMPPGPPDAVRLTVTLGSAGVANVPVYFQNADSSLVMAARTDASGIATVVIDPGGFVTAIDPFAPQLANGLPTPELFTFSGVKPGDQLVLHRDLTALVSMSFTVTPDPAAVSYALFASCLDSGPVALPNAGSAPDVVTLFGCADGTTADFLVVGSDQLNNPVKALLRTNIAVAQNTTVDLGNNYTNTSQVTFGYSGLPASFSSVSVDSSLVTASGRMHQLQSGTGIATGAATVGPIGRPVVAGATQITVSQFFAAQFGTHLVIESAPPSDAYALAVDPALFLPDYTSAPTFDVATHRISITTGPGTGADFATSVIQVTRQEPTFAVWNWHLAAPFSQGVSYPALPADHAQFNPLASDTLNVNSLATLRVPGGYDAWRGHAHDEAVNPALLATGRVFVEQVTRAIGIRANPRR